MVPHKEKKNWVGTYHGADSQSLNYKSIFMKMAPHRNQLMIYYNSVTYWLKDTFLNICHLALQYSSHLSNSHNSRGFFRKLLFLHNV